MRRTLRQLASVKPARYLEPGTPTGLTGLYTASTPRATLLYLYSTTLDKLKAFPEHSVYRQSVEALTKHRMSLVQGVKPAGYDEWAARTIKKIKENPDQLSAAKAVQLESGGDTFVIRRQDQPSDMRDREWDGDKAEEWDGESGHTGEGKRKDPVEQMKLAAELEEEPLLTAEQISELEHKIGAGLIEEVIQVAEAETKLADIMLKAKVWENLEEKPVEGQWKYFERKS